MGWPKSNSKVKVVDSGAFKQIYHDNNTTLSAEYRVTEQFDVQSLSRSTQVELRSGIPSQTNIENGEALGIREGFASRYYFFLFLLWEGPYVHDRFCLHIPYPLVLVLKTDTYIAGSTCYFVSDNNKLIHIR